MDALWKSIRNDAQSGDVEHAISCLDCMAGVTMTAMDCDRRLTALFAAMCTGLRTSDATSSGEVLRVIILQALHNWSIVKLPRDNQWIECMVEVVRVLENDQVSVRAVEVAARCSLVLFSKDEGFMYSEQVVPHLVRLASISTNIELSLSELCVKSVRLGQGSSLWKALEKKRFASFMIEASFDMYLQSSLYVDAHCRFICDLLSTYATGFETNEIQEDASNSICSLIDRTCEFVFDVNKDVALKHSLVMHDCIKLLLQLIQRADSSPIDEFGSVRRPRADVKVDGEPQGGRYSLKVNAVRLIAGLVYDYEAGQSILEENGGLEVLLNQCQHDIRHPFIREWVLFALRNATHRRPSAQERIRALQMQSIVDSPELDAAGIRANLDPETHQLRFRRVEKRDHPRG